MRKNELNTKEDKREFLRVCFYFKERIQPNAPIERFTPDQRINPERKIEIYKTESEKWIYVVDRIEEEIIGIYETKSLKYAFTIALMWHKIPIEEEKCGLKL